MANNLEERINKRAVDEVTSLVKNINNTKLALKVLPDYQDERILQLEKKYESIQKKYSDKLNGKYSSILSACYGNIQNLKSIAGLHSQTYDFGGF